MVLHHTGLPDLVADLGTQTEIFNLALRRFLAATEDEINGGKPFPIPHPPRPLTMAVRGASAEQRVSSA